MTKAHIRTVVILILGIFVTANAHAAKPKQAVGLTSAEVPEYDVNCPVGASDAALCAVDAGTYQGWRIYATHCASCHGAGAVGASNAPGLVDRLRKWVDYDGVQFVVMNGHEGEPGTMPSWKENPNVAVNIDQLYQYLTALADNALPVGTPNKAK